MTNDVTVYDYLLLEIYAYLLSMKLGSCSAKEINNAGITKLCQLRHHGA